jgi:hypothetical protein
VSNAVSNDEGALLIPHAWVYPAFDKAMILFDAVVEVVEVLDRPQFAVRTLLVAYLSA